MKSLRFHVLALSSFTICVLPLGAALATPQHPVKDAARQASPTARWQARQHFQTAYPGLPSDLRSQLKAVYPQLEHQVVDAALQAWQAHPKLAVNLLQEVQAKHGKTIRAARKDVLEALEATYPNFQSRLTRVLEDKGMIATWQRFLNDYDPGLAKELRSLAPRGWTPGKIRDALLTDQQPLVRGGARLDRGQALASEAVAAVRRRAPGLAADFTSRWLDGRQELMQSLQAEFPGAGEVVARTLQAKHPKLASQVLATIEPQTRQARLDLRTQLEARMPGFSTEVENILSRRYPNLRAELLTILKS